MTENNRSKIGSAVKLTIASTLISGIFQAGVIVILARLISPSDYGSYALGVAILSVTTSFVTNSIERTLVVAKQVDFQGLAGAISLASLCAAIITLGCTAIPIREGWITTRTDLLAGLLVGGVVSSLGVAPRVHLRRVLAFRWIVSAELAGIVLGVGVTAVTLAWLGFGAYALVAGNVVQNLVAIAILTLGAPHAASLRPHKSAFTVLKKSFSASRLTALEVAHTQLPSFFMSTLGPTTMGLFNRSQAIVQLPVQLLTASISRVMISSLAAAVVDRSRFLRAARLTVVTTGAIIGPVNFGIAGSHNAFTIVILGEKWSAAAPLIPLLATTSWAVMTSSVLGSISEAARHFSDKTKLQAVASIALIACLGIGVRFGLQAAAIGMTLGALFTAGANLWLTARVLQIGSGSLARWLAPGLTAGLACGVYSWAISFLHAPIPVVFAIQIAGCGLIAAGYYLLLHRDVLLAVAKAALPNGLFTSIERVFARFPNP